MKDPRLVIITGMSGAGKTQVIRALEDIGYFCVDNLPPTFIPKFAELCRQAEGRVDRAGLVVDIRGGEFFDDFLSVLEEMETNNIPYEMLFLEASEEVLIRRYKETRRRHPLAPSGRLSDGIAAERQRLGLVRGRATHIIDTTDMRTADLKQRINEWYSGSDPEQKMTITLLSFGFKYGLPLDADLVFDVRFLPNPFYVAALRKKSGETPAVSDYIWKWPISHQFMEKTCGLLEFLLPNFVKEGKAQLVIAVGCTGGLHRSVFIVRRLQEWLKTQGYRASVEHRDLYKNEVEEG